MRRSRLQIWTQILRAIRRESDESTGPVRPTRVQSAANLPHDRFWGHLRELEARGLVRTDPLALEPRGVEFLQETVRIQDFLERFGLEGDGPRPAEAPRAALAHRLEPRPASPAGDTPA